MIDILPIVAEKGIEKALDMSIEIYNNIPKIPVIYSSRYVDDIGIKKVLELRKQFFGTSIETSDEHYSNLMHMDQHTARVVYRDGVAIGYHSIVPVKIDTYKKFTRGELTHNDILNQSLSWSNIDKKEPIVLYIVGVVVPSNITLKLGRLVDRAAVLGDLSNFLLYIKNIYCIEHLCAYTNPKASSGIKKLMLSIAMQANGEFIQSDPDRVIFVSNRAKDSFRLISSKIDTYLNHTKLIALDDYVIEKKSL